MSSIPVERLADEKGTRWPLGEEVTNPQLYALFYPERQEKGKRSTVCGLFMRNIYQFPVYLLHQ